MSYDAIDLCAGPGGWDTGAAILGLRTVGIETSADACVTARNAGHVRVRRDMTLLDPTRFRRAGRGLIASPPCPPFSKAGSRKGMLDQPQLFAHLNKVAAAGQWVDYDRDGWHDEDSPLTLEPLRWLLALDSEWATFEQVPDVLPLFEAIAVILRAHGYQVWVGVLNAEMYGVPQTRKRAVLAASRNSAHAVGRPPATHDRYVPGRRAPVGLFDDLLPWVSMADALDHPTVNGWRVFTNNDSRTAGGGKERYSRSVAAPSPTISGQVKSWSVRFGNQEHSAVRSVDEPAATIRYGARMNACDWIHTAPATTVQGDPRIAPRGHHDRQFNGDTVRVTVEEAACLQSFPAGYPWAGSNTSRYQQIGNAVPPLLAVAVLGHLHRLDWQPICRDAYRTRAAA